MYASIQKLLFPARTVHPLTTTPPAVETSARSTHALLLNCMRKCKVLLFEPTPSTRTPTTRTIRSLYQRSSSWESPHGSPNEVRFAVWHPSFRRAYTPARSSKGSRHVAAAKPAIVPALVVHPLARHQKRTQVLAVLCARDHRCRHRRRLASKM